MVEQMSTPRAVTVLLTEQASAGAVKVATIGVEAPGARVIGPITAVPAPG